MKRTAIFAVIPIVLLCCVSCGGAVKTRVVVAGSTSVMPYMEALAEEYGRIRPDAVIDVQGGGSSAGITALGSGAADIAMSSRALKGDERRYYSAVIAKDGLAVIVHPDNPVNNLTTEQLRGIYAGTITDWRALGAGLDFGYGGDIYAICREEGSGTRAFFEEQIMGGQRVSAKTVVQNAGGAVRLLVANNRQAIGFVSLETIAGSETQKPVKALEVDGIAPTVDNINGGVYRLYRPFLIAASEKRDAAADDFIAFILSDEGRNILKDRGLAGF